MDIFLLLEDCDHVGLCQLKIYLSDPYSVFFVSIFFGIYGYDAPHKCGIVTFVWLGLLCLLKINWIEKLREIASTEQIRTRPRPVRCPVRDNFSRVG